jgi:biopolymer transport protein TolR
MAMNLQTAGRGKVAPQMNVTPLVDVVLVLLIIFMVVTPLLTKKFWLHVPKKEEQVETPPPNEQKPLVLRYGKDGRIMLNASVISNADLPERLRRALAARQDGVLFFDADSDADYGEAVHVMDTARGAGAVSIAVLTESLQ